MTTSIGIVGLGTQILIGDAVSPPNYNLLIEAKDISGPEITQDFVDFTHQQSTGGFRERKPQFKTSGACTFQLAFISDDTYHQALINAALAVPATVTHFKLLYPDASYITFDAYPSVKFNAPLADRLAIDVTLNLEGNMDITY